MGKIILKLKDLYAGYSEKWVLKDINLNIYKNKITAILGPSGCGKSTLLKTINKLHDLSKNSKRKGKIYLDNIDIDKIHTSILRQKIGMVFQKPNPFPFMSIYDNVIAGYILNGIKLTKEEKDYIVESSLRKAFLWNEVKGSLHKKGIFLSGGQQQRLCIARTLAMNPEIILLDEPTSALDPKATSMIEELLLELKEMTTVILVTHNISQAFRVSDYIAFLYLGELVEYNETDILLRSSKDRRTAEYFAGRFG